MFREALTAPVATDDTVWPVLTRSAPSARVEDVARAPFQPTPIARDVPVAVGALLFGGYLALIGALALATAGSATSKYVVALAAMFVVSLFVTPAFLLAQEPKNGRRPNLEQFLAKGMQTHTGHCSGGEAMVQMLIVPVLLTLAILAIAFEMAFVI